MGEGMDFISTHDAVCGEVQLVLIVRESDAALLLIIIEVDPVERSAAAVVGIGSHAMVVNTSKACLKRVNDATTVVEQVITKTMTYGG